MIQVRRNTFETNSSSTHSLVISKQDHGYNFNLPVDNDGTLVIPFGEFDWEPDILKEPIAKLSYLITDRCGIYIDYDGERSRESITAELLEMPEMINIIKVIKENCPQVENIAFDFGNDYDPFLGYIDHDSVGTSRFETSWDIDLKDFIFSNKVIILIDNDNNCYFYDYFPWEINGKFEANKNIEDLFTKNKEDLL